MPAARTPSQQPRSAAEVVRLQRTDEQRPASKMLGDELRRQRESRGYTLEQAARVLRASISKVSRVELGVSPAKPRDVHDLADFYRLSREERAEIEQLLAQATQADLYDLYADVTPRYLVRLIRLEQQAKEVCVWDPRVVPGLLQTPAYARAMVEAADLGLSSTEVGRTVDLRLGRQRELNARKPRFEALIDELVLYRLRGSIEDMIEQIDHLLQAPDHYKVRIVSPEAPTSPSPVVHLKLVDGAHQEVAYVENLNSAIYVTKKPGLDRYRQLLTRVRDLAMDRKESIEALKKARKHWESKLAAVSSEH
ncbi:helix-turn-helix domain-containing protein [Streptomyces physcomitrii]|uniref:helix-turn-helix domain-containing protein n=2 Tax=Streptomyces physcomitrii TaxID=2724184 RepID=UPI000863323B|nr:hypothetical protein SLNHY_7003 [Streptomyces albus]